jgi:hypothetical protein
MKEQNEVLAAERQAAIEKAKQEAQQREELAKMMSQKAPSLARIESESADFDGSAPVLQTKAPARVEIETPKADVLAPVKVQYVPDPRQEEELRRLRDLLDMKEAERLQARRRLSSGSDDNTNKDDVAPLSLEEELAQGAVAARPSGDRVSKDEYTDIAGVRDEYADIAGVRDEYTDIAGVRDEYADIAGVRDEYAEVAGMHDEYTDIAGPENEYALVKSVNHEYADVVGESSTLLGDVQRLISKHDEDGLVDAKSAKLAELDKQYQQQLEMLESLRQQFQKEQAQQQLLLGAATDRPKISRNGSLQNLAPEAKRQAFQSMLEDRQGRLSRKSSAQNVLDPSATQGQPSFIPDDLKRLAEMFPSLDFPSIQAIYETRGGDVNACVEQLLEMQQGFGDNNPFSAPTAWPVNSAAGPESRLSQKDRLKARQQELLQKKASRSAQLNSNLDKRSIGEFIISEEEKDRLRVEEERAERQRQLEIKKQEERRLWEEQQRQLKLKQEEARKLKAQQQAHYEAIGSRGSPDTLQRRLVGVSSQDFVFKAQPPSKSSKEEDYDFTPLWGDPTVFPLLKELKKRNEFGVVLANQERLFNVCPDVLLMPAHFTTADQAWRHAGCPCSGPELQVRCAVPPEVHAHVYLPPDPGMACLYEVSRVEACYCCFCCS